MEEFNAKKEIESLSKTILLTGISCIGYIMLGYYFTDKRLDAHKEVIELQQKQINQLIINAKYDKQKQNR